MIPRKPILLTGGLVFQGDGSKPRQQDILIVGGKISFGTELSRPPETRVVCLDGLCVSPGWLDLHTHVFQSNGVFSVPPSSIGLQSGVTTLVDAGSAGALQYRAFSENVIQRAAETVIAYVNVANTGIMHGHAGREGYVGDHFHTSLYDPRPALDLLEGFSSSIVGWKARLTAILAANDPALESLAFDRLCMLREQSGLPVMVHHIRSNIPADHLLTKLSADDVYTHLYHGQVDTIFDDTGRPSREALRARERGVLFDVGHGSGSFNWECAEGACRTHGFWPDAISSDLHRYNTFWPVVDLATTMSKFLCLGAPEEQIIAMVTGNVQRALRRSSYGKATSTDLTIFTIEKGRFALADSLGRERISDRRFVPLAVFKGGDFSPCSGFPASGFTNGAFAQGIQDAAAY